MHPKIYATTAPHKPAIVMADTGETVTYAQLDCRSNQGAHLFRDMGLVPGDVIAIFMDNAPVFLETAWAAQRSGLYYACISARASTNEVEYIVSDSNAKVLICSERLSGIAREAIQHLSSVRLLVATMSTPGAESFELVRERYPASPINDESAGSDMLYSSGTTGRPKGIKPKGSAGRPIDAPDRVTTLAQGRFGLTADSVYLSPAPLYHAAPLRWCMAVHRLGATVIMLGKFDPALALAAIQKYGVDAAQWVPTHFVRLLKLDESQRLKFNVSSLKIAIHAAAPCAIPVKEAMISWWGPILHEYYGGSEGIGMTAISCAEWRQKRGSVGRAISGEIHICGDNGAPLSNDQDDGVVYFSGGGDFEYHNDPEKTAESHNALGWATMGDIGHLDRDGYLYLTDRKNFMFISGGVNIYPQEIENQLIDHPAVADVAVFGAPDDEMGERAVAVIQPVQWEQAGPALAAELIAFVRSKMSHVKAPRQIDFMKELPRHENGKLYKRLLRDAYWANRAPR
jgi:long-chain acyl-CoA synthetase